MKNSLIPKKNVVTGKEYWCVTNDHRVLNLMKYMGHQIFKGSELSANSKNVRVMFEGDVSIEKSNIPESQLVEEKHYWCRYRTESELVLMRYDKSAQFYSISHDVYWEVKDVKVIFEDCEH